MGRDKDARRLARGARGAEGAAVVGRALHGLGGVGKTRLAIEYALAHAADYSALLFVRADDPATLDSRTSPRSRARPRSTSARRKRAQDEAKIEAALRWLEAHPTWLMILDNVDDEEAVAAVSKLMARLKGGHVIVTARAANFPASLRKLELDVLDEDAATASSWSARTANARGRRRCEQTRARLARELGGSRARAGTGRRLYREPSASASRDYLTLWRENRKKVVDWFDPDADELRP